MKKKQFTEEQIISALKQMEGRPTAFAYSYNLAGALASETYPSVGCRGEIGVWRHDGACV